jgi:hypothetical protein
MSPSFARKPARCALIALCAMIRFMGPNVIGLDTWVSIPPNNANPLTGTR